MTKRTGKKVSSRASRKGRYWSAEVTRRSNALDLESGVFKKETPRAIALSLRRSAERSQRRKAGAYQSAMSMLNFYINRAGRGLSRAQKGKLQRAKEELRRLYKRDEPKATRTRGG
ncbi:MAG TPA: DUF3175 domain-containing protein, partial [Vicinamibacteria bacterium]